MQSIKTLGDLLSVLSIYPKELPVQFVSNGSGGRWPLTASPMTCGVDEAICHVNNQAMHEPDHLRISLFPSYEDRQKLNQRVVIEFQRFVFEPEHEQVVRDMLRKHGGAAAGLKQAADYIGRLEQRVRELEAAQ